MVPFTLPFLPHPFDLTRPRAVVPRAAPPRPAPLGTLLGRSIATRLVRCVDRVENALIVVPPPAWLVGLAVVSVLRCLARC